MLKEIKARYSKGIIEPLEKLDLAEGEEVDVTISIRSKPEDVLSVLKSTAGAWKGTNDPDELKRSIYSDRLVKTRPQPKL